MNKRIKLERIVSDIKLRFDVEPEIQGDVIIVDAGKLTISEASTLQRYLTKKGIETNIQSSVTFILTL